MILLVIYIWRHDRLLNKREDKYTFVIIKIFLNSTWYIYPMRGCWLNILLHHCYKLLLWSTKNYFLVWKHLYKNVKTFCCVLYGSALECVLSAYSWDNVESEKWLRYTLESYCRHTSSRLFWIWQSEAKQHPCSTYGKSFRVYPV